MFNARFVLFKCSVYFISMLHVLLKHKEFTCLRVCTCREDVTRPYVTREDVARGRMWPERMLREGSHKRCLYVSQEMEVTRVVRMCHKMYVIWVVRMCHKMYMSLGLSVCVTRVVEWNIDFIKFMLVYIITNASSLLLTSLKKNWFSLSPWSQQNRDLSKKKIDSLVFFSLSPWSQSLILSFSLITSIILSWWEDHKRYSLLITSFILSFDWSQSSFSLSSQKE